MIWPTLCWLWHQEVGLRSASLVSTKDKEQYNWIQCIHHQLQHYWIRGKEIHVNMREQRLSTFPFPWIYILLPTGHPSDQTEPNPPKPYDSRIRPYTYGQRLVAEVVQTKRYGYGDRIYASYGLRRTALDRDSGHSMQTSAAFPLKQIEMDNQRWYVVEKKKYFRNKEMP